MAGLVGVMFEFWLKSDLYCMKRVVAEGGSARLLIGEMPLGSIYNYY